MPPFVRIGPFEMMVLAGEEEEIAVGVDNLLLEQDDGSQLLLENDDLLILEG